MSKQLRELRSLNNIPLHIPQHIISQRLHNLVHIEEHDIDGVTLKRSHRVLDDEGMITIRWKEERHRCNRIDGRPIEEVLHNISSISHTSELLVP